jgi:hypothetical protein
MEVLGSHEARGHCNYTVGFGWAIKNDCREELLYLFTANGLSPGGSTHLHTNNTQNNTNNNRKTQIQNNVEECGPCPVFASFTLAFAL